MRYTAIARKNPVDKSVKYYPINKIYTNISAEAIVDYAVQNSNVERSVIEQAMVGLQEAIHTFLCNGHPLQFWPLGSFRISISGKGVPTAADVTAAQVKSARIVFVPSPLLKGKFNPHEIAFERIETREGGESANS